MSNKLWDDNAPAILADVRAVYNEHAKEHGRQGFGRNRCRCEACKEHGESACDCAYCKAINRHIGQALCAKAKAIADKAEKGKA